MMPPRVTLLSGGVGGAKLAFGFYAGPAANELTVIANTADDISLYGLHVSPDCDSLVYTLAGRANPETGWGVAGDSFRTLETLRALGDDPWFQLGDLDLATHLFRTRLLDGGAGLAEATRRIAEGMGVKCAIIPACEEPIPTRIVTDIGEMHLQEYLAVHHAEPAIVSIHQDGMESARPTPGVMEAILASDLIVAAPSNPFISIGPILAIPGIREAIGKARGVKIGVSPIIGGRALKGPAAKMLKDLGYPVGAVSVARIWADWLDLFVVDEQDRDLREEIEALGLKCAVLPTVMETAEEKHELARRILTLG